MYPKITERLATQFEDWQSQMQLFEGEPENFSPIQRDSRMLSDSKKHTVSSIILLASGCNYTNCEKDAKLVPSYEVWAGQKRACGMAFFREVFDTSMIFLREGIYPV